MKHTLIIFCVFEVLNLSGNLIQLATSSQGGSVQQSPNQTSQQTPAAQNSQTNLGSVVMVSNLYLIMTLFFCHQPTCSTFFFFIFFPMLCKTDFLSFVRAYCFSSFHLNWTINEYLGNTIIVTWVSHWPSVMYNGFLPHAQGVKWQISGKGVSNFIHSLNFTYHLGYSNRSSIILFYSFRKRK